MNLFESVKVIDINPQHPGCKDHVLTARAVALFFMCVCVLSKTTRTTPCHWQHHQDNCIKDEV